MDITNLNWGFSTEEREQLINDIVVATGEPDDKKLRWRSDQQLLELADCLVINDTMTRDQVPPGQLYVPRGTRIVFED